MLLVLLIIGQRRCAFHVMCGVYGHEASLGFRPTDPFKPRACMRPWYPLYPLYSPPLQPALASKPRNTAIGNRSSTQVPATSCEGMHGLFYSQISAHFPHQITSRRTNECQRSALNDPPPLHLESQKCSAENLRLRCVSVF